MQVGQTVTVTLAGKSRQQKVVGVYKDGSAVIVADGDRLVSVIRRNATSGSWELGRMPVTLEEQKPDLTALFAAANAVVPPLPKEG